MLRKLLAVDHKVKLPFHHEHRRRNHGWSNEIGEVKMDSKLPNNNQNLIRWAK